MFFTYSTIAKMRMGVKGHIVIDISVWFNVLYFGYVAGRQLWLWNDNNLYSAQI